MIDMVNSIAIRAEWIMLTAGPFIFYSALCRLQSYLCPKRNLCCCRKAKSSNKEESDDY